MVSINELKLVLQFIVGQGRVFKESGSYVYE